jgi:hypothetical protein
MNGDPHLLTSNPSPSPSSSSPSSFRFAPDAGGRTDLSNDGCIDVKFKPRV